MSDYAPLCKRQTEYIRRCEKAWLNVAEGGKRAGKNIINLIAWAASLETHPDTIHLAAGVSTASAKMNIIDSDGYGLKWLFQGRCREGQYNGRDALIIHTAVGDKAVLIAGGGDSRSASLIKGYSLGSVYVTEVNECHQTFVQEVIDRTLASSKRQVFFDLNPKPPSHWFYRDFLDYQDELKAKGLNDGYNYGHFTIADNLSISRQTMMEAVGKYDRASIWYQRDILGLRTSAEGRIYTTYNREDVSISMDEIREMKFAELCVGVDVGGTDATVATLSGITRDYKTIVHIDGMYHKQTIDEKMTEANYARMIVQWLKPLVKQFPNIGTVYVDSANKLFRAALKERMLEEGLGRYTVKPFDKTDGILQRIELTCMLMAQGRYRVNEKLEKWHEALQMAVWSVDKFQQGEWVRVDDGSYPVDCLDSAEYSFYTFKRYLLT